MAAAEHSVTVERTPEDVYAFLVDGLNNAKWRSGVRSVSHASGPAGQEGAVYAQRLAGPGGREIDGDYEITEARPGEVIRFQVIAGPARPHGVFLIGPDGGGTRVTFGLSYEPSGFMKLMGGMIQKTMDHEVAQLETLKTVLEA
ncbi:SRPBCC family protein [Sinomonas sp. ASV486]|uniref:SRPBCC family protein n=1 Tax=Sinomonas sp. ASV486 TaxID=3051170 RepID=UPI0027DBB2E7|nr:SRPBCC family protein [Sinomonas sp. ASV486]MDQ4491676.1 SRPBCC family protein [Sinomonas sp. ASV486]